MQIMKMLDDAFARIPDSPGIVLHSDQGWQYQMKQYQLRLRQKGITQRCRARVTVWITLLWKVLWIIEVRIIIFAKFSSIDHFRKELEEYIDYTITSG